MESPQLNPETNGSPTLPGSSEGQSIWAIIGNVFMAPTKAFAAFSQKPALLIPLIVLIVAAALVGAGSGKYGAMLQYDMFKTSTVIPAANLEEMRQQALDPNLLTTALFAPIAVLVASLLGALLSWSIAGVIFGGKSRFKIIWGVGLLAALIGQSGGLLRLPLVYAKGTMLVSYGLAALMPGKDMTSIIYSLAYYFDFFMIWSIIVLGIAYATIFGISRGKGIATAAITTCVMVGLGIGLTTLGLGFAGVEITWF